MDSKTKFLIAVAALAVVLPAPSLHAQGGDLPVSFGRNDILPLTAIDLQTLPAVNVPLLIAEDALYAELDHIDRIGAWIKTDISPANVGTWETLPEGGELWRVQIVSTGALWLAPAFGTFRLPSGAGMWVYDPLYEQVEGGYGIDDVRPHGQRAVAPLSDEHVVVELHWPAPLRGQTANMHMGAMFHGYKPLFPQD